MEKRPKNCIRGKIPKVDAVRDLLSRIDPKEIEEIHAQTIDVLKRNRVFREGTIGGYVAAGIDGVELFSSTKKSCPDCLSRKNGTRKTEYFHRSVVCMTVGKSPHVIFGQKMLKPRDGSEKDEGELTGAKRLIRHLKKRHGDSDLRLCRLNGADICGEVQQRICGTGNCIHILCDDNGTLYVYAGSEKRR